MKPLVGLLAALLLSGCAITTSTGYLQRFPSDEAPIVHCYAVAYQYMPPFVYPADENVPKRAVLQVKLRDYRTSKLILRYETKPKASPRNLHFIGSLHGDLFILKTHDDDTRQSWTLRFQRQSDGQFQFIDRQGSFRD